MKSNLLFIFTLLIVSGLNAQDNIIPAGHRMMSMADRYEILSGKFVKGTQMTGGFVQRKHILELISNDSGLSLQDIFNRDKYLNKDLQLGRNTEFPNFNRSPFYRNIFASPAYFMDYYDSAKNYRITLNPVLAIGVGKDLVNTSKTLYRNTRGVEIKGFIGKKQNFGFYSIATENQTALPDFVNYYTDSFGYLPNQTFWKKFKKTGYDYFQARGYVWWDINSFVTLRFGQDKVFWGNGIRSMVLGDFSPANLFFQINTNLGIFNYQNYYGQFTDFSTLTGATLLKRKFGTFHRLGVNISKNVNIGVFEAVIFDRQDSTQSDRYDLAYLNPLIFYRAIEQQLGSRDNAVLGLDWKWNFLKRFQFYGQFVLDEFVLKEIKAQSGWWANKFSFQTGAKYVNMFGVSNLDFQAEFNVVRPYTYSHFRSGGNWANFGQPLAHPLGANFKEIIVKLSAQPLNRLYVDFTFLEYIKGEDFSVNGVNYGGNILRDYSKRVGDYGNKIGQGKAVGAGILDLNIAYMLWHNFFVESRIYYKLYDFNDRYPNTKWFNVGIRWNIDSEQRLMYY
ncbi:MAG: hypothetical protein LC109_02090 [Bacteroidia bacterium]|nr:hypothetical protein [Bacteroidia bacterium]